MEGMESTKLRLSAEIEGPYLATREKIMKNWKERLLVQYADYEDAVTVYSLVMGFLMDEIDPNTVKDMDTGLQFLVIAELAMEYMDYFDTLAVTVWDNNDCQRGQGDKEMRAEILLSMGKLNGRGLPDTFMELCLSFFKTYYMHFLYEESDQKKIEAAMKALEDSQTDGLAEMLAAEAQHLPKPGYEEEVKSPAAKKSSPTEPADASQEAPAEAGIAPPKTPSPTKPGDAKSKLVTPNEGGVHQGVAGRQGFGGTKDAFKEFPSREAMLTPESAKYLSRLGQPPEEENDDAEVTDSELADVVE